jgi:hypothetical protein
MGSQPGGQGRRRTVGEQIQHTVPLHVNQDGSIPTASTESEVIDTQDAHGPYGGERLAPEEPQQCADTRPQAQARCGTHTRTTAQRESLLEELRLRARGPPCTMRDQMGQPFAEDSAGTPLVPTAEAPHPQRDGDCSATAGHIVVPPFIVAMQVRGASATARTSRGATRRGEDHEALIYLEHILHPYLACLRKEQGGKSHGVSPVEAKDRCRSLPSTYPRHVQHREGLRAKYPDHRASLTGKLH